jgi:predicted short-subunit dehydrogenase-like oxidoreductase (DUF2520 family)
VALSLNIIGGGHVGRALGRLFSNSGSFMVQDVLTRSLAGAQAAVDFIGAGRAVDDMRALRPADAIMLAVTDDQIAAVADRLMPPMADSLALPVVDSLALPLLPLAGTVVFHCSGAKSSHELSALKAQGALVASMHPIRSFADPAMVAANFSGTFCGIEGDAQALAILEQALADIGGRAVPIDASAKTVYHAASVFASNYLVTIIDAALRAYEAAGVAPEVALELAKPLATETLQNVFRLGPAKALSGPIARGDTATVARQQQALNAWHGPTGQLYAALVAATTDLAKRRSD